MPTVITPHAPEWKKKYSGQAGGLASSHCGAGVVSVALSAVEVSVEIGNSKRPSRYQKLYPRSIPSVPVVMR